MSDDAIECKLRMYANVVTHGPAVSIPVPEFTVEQMLAAVDECWNSHDVDDIQRLAVMLTQAAHRIRELTETLEVWKDAAPERQD